MRNGKQVIGMLYGDKQTTVVICEYDIARFDDEIPKAC